MKNAAMIYVPLLMLLFAVAGCRRADVPSDLPRTLEVIGYGEAPEEEQAVGDLERQLGLAQRADASVALDASIPSQAQQHLMARAGARRQALRALAQEILAARIEADRTLGQLLAEAEPRRREEFERILDQNARVVFREDDEHCHAVATMPIKVVADWQAEWLDVAELDRQSEHTARINRMAYERATNNARANLYDLIMALPADFGGTVRQRIAREPELEQAVRDLVEDIAFDEIEYPSSGACRAVIRFEVARVHELLDDHSRRRSR